MKFSSKEKHSSIDSFGQSLEVLQERLNQRWILGDREGLLEENNKVIHPSFYECNPLYLDKFLKTQKALSELLITIKGQSYDFHYEAYAFDSKNDFIIELKEKKSQKKVKIKFLNSCRSTYLVQSIYQSGQYQKKGNLWDNYAREVFIDKYYVTNLDINIWKNKSLNLEESDAHRPATNLSLTQKKEYCSSRDAHLLQAHFFDAASFIPNSNPSDYIFIFPYPWTKKRSLKQMSTEKLCNHFFFKECQNYKFHSPYAPSWSGIFHTLGSYPESFDSKFDNLNLKISSKNLSRTSRSHELGFRVKNNDKIMSAFRCMEER